MGFDTSSWLNSSGSSGGGSFFNSGSSGGGNSFNYGTDTSKYWDSSSDPTPGSGSGSAYEWASKLPAGSDPFGLNKNKDKKQFPWGDVTRFAGDALNSYAQSKSGQGGGFAGGGGGVSQSGDLTIVYPQSPTVIEGKKSGLGSSIGGILGTVAGIALAPVTGGASMALGPALGSAAGGAFG
jgi:hypothetical protein